MTSTTTVTVLFTDVLGDAAAERALQAHNKLIREQIGPSGGREVKTIGDAFMIAFPSTRKAVDCATAIQRALGARNRGNADAQVQVRIGINAGEATEEAGDLSGTAVNVAKYVEAKAQPEQILVTETIKALIGPVQDIHFVDRGRFRLKGFTERWHLYEVPWLDEAAAAHSPPSLLRRAHADGCFRANWLARSKVSNWPILLKNSIRPFRAAILGVSNHHLINLRGSESVLEGRLLRRPSLHPLQGSFSTE